MVNCDEKVIIGGTGRSGTTFIIQMLTEMGMETGFDMDNIQRHLYKDKRAGMEFRIQFSGTLKKAREYFNKEVPQIIKSPTMSLFLKLLLDLKVIKVAHVIIPVRSMLEVVKSREDNDLQWIYTKKDDLSQKIFSGYVLGSIIEACVLHNIPYTTMSFPEIVNDREYCFNKLRLVFEHLDKERFDKAFTKLSKPKMIQTPVEKFNIRDDNVIEITA